jgi:hypothetical protein
MLIDTPANASAVTLCRLIEAISIAIWHIRLCHFECTLESDAWSFSLLETIAPLLNVYYVILVDVACFNEWLYAHFVLRTGVKEREREALLKGEPLFGRRLRGSTCLVVF